MFESLKKSLRLLLTPELRWYLLGPLLVNITLFGVLGYYLLSLIPDFMLWFEGWLPSWLSLLSWLVAPVVIISVVLIGISTFNIVGNIIAAPLNAFLSEKVEKLVLGDEYQNPEERTIASEIVHALAREMKKLWYYLPRLLVVLVITFIPGVNFVAPVVWFLFGAWLMAFQYFDYPLDNNRFDFDKSKTWIHQRPLKSLTFGGITSMLFLVPALNLFMMPLCVVWATMVWIEEKEKK